MNTASDLPLDSLAQAQLRRLRQVHRFTSVVFCLGMLGIFGGLATLAVSLSVGSVLMSTGFALVGLVLLQCYVVYPRLLCPRCCHRYFLPDGNWHWLYRINMGRNRCLHCGLSLQARVRS